MMKIEDLIFGTATKIKEKIDSAIDTVSCDIDAARKASGNKASALEIVLLDDGFHALQAHRAAHLLYKKGWSCLAEVVSRATRYSTGIEIHPAAKIEKGVAIRILPSVTIEKDAVITKGNTVISIGTTVGCDTENRSADDFRETDDAAVSEE
ncbi:MAG: hypothetical protein SOZ62_00670 [Eubacteriales bacterium]|nr:hypothetical protein [Eubacteriales bacterium]